MNVKTILLIEDDYLDVVSVKRELKKIAVEHTLYVVHNGADALDLINGNYIENEKVLPDIILLDINMPRMNGHEFLRVIKNYYNLNNIKIFIMTTSEEEYDRLTAENLGVDGYILKPLDLVEIHEKSEARKLVSALRADLY